MNKKDLVKLAMTLGFGVKIGTECADLLLGICGNLFLKWADAYMLKRAKEGQETAKELCKKWGLDASEEEEKTEEIADE